MRKLYTAVIKLPNGDSHLVYIPADTFEGAQVVADACSTQRVIIDGNLIFMVSSNMSEAEVKAFASAGVMGEGRVH